MDLLISDNDSICLLCQLYHEPVIVSGDLLAIFQLGGSDRKHLEFVKLCQKVALSHPPVLLQLPGGYKHGDLSVPAVPEVLHCHGDASA